MPIGTILPYTGDLNKIPSGWHLCDGTDGTPNLLDGRFLEGAANIGIFREPGLPNITGYFSADARNYALEGAFYQKTMNGTGTEGSHTASGSYKFDFDASRSNSIYGASNTVQPLSYTVYFIIKMK